MKNSILKLYALLFLSCLGCANPTENKVKNISEEPEQKANQIVLIFEKAPQNSRYTWPDGASAGSAPPYEVRYIDDHHISRLFTPKLAPARDTLVLPTTRHIVEVQHAYLGIDNFSYLLHNGDSVLFTYEGRKPTASILNRKALSWDVNYELQKRKLLSIESFSGLLRIHPRFAFRDSAYHDIADLNKRTAKARKAGYKAAISEYNAENKLLDSLRHYNLISLNIYKFYKDKAAFDLSNQYFFYPISEPFKGDSILLSINELRNTINDSLAEYFYYEQMQKVLRSHYFDSKADLITTSNERYRDYRQVYDSIQISKLFSNKVKRLFLFSTIDDLINTSSLDDRVKYWQKFKQDIADSAFINHISNKYHLEKELSNELQLKTLNDAEIDFTDVLAMHPNKVIYIDFWASWCAPCIRALPASKKLHEEYRNEDVVFIYLSKDEDIDKWKQAADKHQLNDNLKSFIIDNQHTSKMLDELQVRSIPRYMIFDKKGNLVHKNSPGPGSEETRKLLNKYLKESSDKVSSL